MATARARLWFEAGVAWLSGVLAVATLFWPDWIEALTGFDPDRHSGSFEWLIVAGLFATCVFAWLVARAEWRRSILMAEQ
jgi:hypothetical protein